MAESMSPCTERGVDLTGLDARDDGDLALPTQVEAAEAAIAGAVGEVIDSEAVPVLLGGDHGVTVPAFGAVLARRPGLHYLVFDAHPDLYPDYQGDPFSHACISHRIAQLAAMDGERIHQVGIRASNPSQREAASRLGVETVGAWELDRFDASAIDGPVYLSIDIDVLDPAHAPGCGNPVPGGLSTRQLLDAIHQLGDAGVEIAAVDVVEVNPLLDDVGITALAAARIVAEVLGVLAAGS